MAAGDQSRDYFGGGVDWRQHKAYLTQIFAVICDRNLLDSRAKALEHGAVHCLGPGPAFQDITQGMTLAQIGFFVAGKGILDNVRRRTIALETKAESQIIETPVLQGMPEKKPTAPDQLMRVPGLTPGQAAKYGPPFLNVRGSYVCSHALAGGTEPVRAAPRTSPVGPPHQTNGASAFQGSLPRRRGGHQQAQRHSPGVQYGAMSRTLRRDFGHIRNRLFEKG